MNSQYTSNKQRQSHNGLTLSYPVLGWHDVKDCEIRKPNFRNRH